MVYLKSRFGTIIGAIVSAPAKAVVAAMISQATGKLSSNYHFSLE